MIRYPIKLTKDSDGTLLITAPDLPEVTSFAVDADDVVLRAADAVATALQGRISDRKEIPAPSPVKRGQRVAVLSTLVAAKLALYRAMLETNTRKADLARRLKVHPPQIDRLLDLDHDSRLEQIENAAQALGREMHIELVPAA